MKYSNSIAASITLFITLSYALSAGFYSTYCPVSNTTDYYSIDSGPDDGTCYNIGEVYPGWTSPKGGPPHPFCAYLTHGGAKPPKRCPGPYPFDAYSLSVDTYNTPPGTKCNLYFNTDCVQGDNPGASVSPIPYLEYTVTNGHCSDIPEHFPFSSTESISSFECFAPKKS